MKTKSAGRYNTGMGVIQVSKAEAAKAAKAYSEASVSPTRKIRDITSIMGIPEDEYTPKVRQAIMTLLQEVDNLRKSLDDMSRRLEAEKHLADQDALLPVYNRRAFVRELTKVQASVERYQGNASLVYIDLNDFKTINDQYGHQAGDHVLYEFARKLVGSVRETDIVGRLGGDEFGIILPHTSQDASSTLMNRLSRDLEARPVLWENQLLAVSMSYGITTVVPGQDAQETMSTADSAMYLNKKQNKDTQN